MTVLAEAERILAAAQRPPAGPERPALSFWALLPILAWLVAGEEMCRWAADWGEALTCRGNHV